MDLDKTIVPDSLLDLDKTFVPRSSEGFEDRDDRPRMFLPGETDFRRSWWEGPTVNTAIATETEEDDNIDNHDECNHHIDDHEDEVMSVDYDLNSTWIKGTISAPHFPSEKRRPNEHLHQEAKRLRPDKDSEPDVEMHNAEKHHHRHRCKKIQTCNIHPKKLAFSSANSRSSSASANSRSSSSSAASTNATPKFANSQSSSGLTYLLQGYGRQLCPGPRYTEKRCHLALLGLRTLVTERGVTMEEVVAAGVFPLVTKVLMRKAGHLVKLGGLKTVLACWLKSSSTTRAFIVEELGDFVVEGLAARGGEVGALAVQLIETINEFSNQ